MSYANPIVLIAPATGQAAPVNVTTGAAFTYAGGTLTNVDLGSGARAWRNGGAAYVDMAWTTGRAISAANTTPDGITIVIFGAQSAAPSAGSFMRLLQVGELANNPDSSGIGIQRGSATQANCAWIDAQSASVAGIDWTQRRAYVAQMAINEGGGSNDICRLWAGGLTGTPDVDTGATLRGSTNVLDNIRLGMLNGGAWDYERIAIWLGATGPTLAECRALANCTTPAQFDALLAGPAAPVLSAPIAPTVGTTTATVGATTDTASGTLYVQLLPAATAVPTAAAIIAAPTQSVAVSSTGAKTFNLTALTASTAYRAHFAQTGPSNVVSTASFTTAAAGTAPTISAHPAGATVTAGATHTMSVTASGTAPLSYQWFKNGASISGATLASYTTPALAVGDNGAAFTVVVFNSAGNVTSNAATVNVNAASGTYSATLPAVLTDASGSTMRLSQATRMVAEPFTTIEALGTAARHIVTATTNASTGVVTISDFPSAGVWAVLGVFPSTGATIDGVRFRLATAN